MSFILEALKKSEKSRQQTSVPDINTQHHNQPQPASKKPLLAGFALALLIVNATILIWLFGPWTQPKPEVESNATIIEQPLPQTLPTTKIETGLTRTPSFAHAKTEELSRAENNNAIEVTLPIMAATVATAEIKAQPPATMKPIVIDQPRILSIDDLPPHLQQQVQHLHMSVHSYTGDNGSLIRLNNKILHQGSVFEDNYRIEQITRDGAIVNFHGYTFELLRAGR